MLAGGIDKAAAVTEMISQHCSALRGPQKTACEKAINQNYAKTCDSAASGNEQMCLDEYKAILGAQHGACAAANRTPVSQQVCVFTKLDNPTSRPARDFKIGDHASANVGVYLKELKAKAAEAPEDLIKAISKRGIDDDAKKKMYEAQASINQIVEKEPDASREAKRAELQGILDTALKAALEEALKKTKAEEQVASLNEYLKGAKFAKVMEELGGAAGVPLAPLAGMPRTGFYLDIGEHLNLNQDFYPDSSPGGAHLKDQRSVAGFGLRNMAGGLGLVRVAAGWRFDRISIFPENFRLSVEAEVKADLKWYAPVLPGDTFDVGDGYGKQSVTPQIANALAENSKGSFLDVAEILKLKGEFFHPSPELGGFLYAGGGVGLGLLERFGFSDGKFVTGSYETQFSQADKLGAFAVIAHGEVFAGYENQRGWFVECGLDGHTPIHDTSINAEGLKIDRTLGSADLGCRIGIKGIGK